LEDFDEVHVLEPNNVNILESCRAIKMMLHDYQKALENLDKADVFEPNNAFTLQSCGIVKNLNLKP
jgi:hypothetical protein